MLVQNACFCVEDRMLGWEGSLNSRTEGCCLRLAVGVDEQGADLFERLVCFLFLFYSMGFYGW